MERKNKGLAWAYLKRTIIMHMGEAQGQVVLAQYYELLHQEYKDRQRIKAASELIELRGKLAQAEMQLNLPDIRRYERMIAHREALVKGGDE